MSVIDENMPKIDPSLYNAHDLKEIEKKKKLWRMI